MTGAASPQAALLAELERHTGDIVVVAPVVSPYCLSSGHRSQLSRDIVHT
jgi:hypothetical protein